MRVLAGVALVVAVMLLPGPALAQCDTVPSRMPEPDLNIYPKEKDIQKGQTTFKTLPDLLSHWSAGRYNRIYRDPELTGYVDSLLAKLLASSPEYARIFTYRSVVLGIPDMNAVSFSGGYIGVTLGLIADAPSEDFIARMLAHEIGHAALRHTTAWKSREALYDLELSVLDREYNSPRVSFGQEYLSAIRLVMMDILKRTRDLDRYRTSQEEDADLFGSRVAVTAGYNLTSSEEYSRKRAEGQGRGYADWATHPPDRRRADVIACEMSGKMLDAEQRPLEFLAAREYAQKLLAALNEELEKIALP